MKTLVAALTGLLFGAGLLVSGMTDPARVLAFLDVAGAWNPALALVMGGAVVAALPAFALARRRRTALLGDPIQLPSRVRIDAPLIGGAAIFGVGWGLSGLCPAPAIVLLGLDPLRAAAFVGPLILGAWLGGRPRAPDTVPRELAASPAAP
jgi:uncharacterized protein